MTQAFVEHVNLTVENPDQAAELLTRLFGWKIRWSGSAKNDGHTVHVGSENHYLALYTHPESVAAQEVSYATYNGLNHIGIVVDDLDATEARIKAEGLETFNHGDYEPGCRFYFMLDGRTEFEVVSYQ